MAASVEDAVLESDIDGIRHGSGSSAPRVQMDPMQDVLVIVQQMVEDNKAEGDHQKLD